MIDGIPAFFTESSLKNINRIEDIENPKINYKIFNNLVYGQWTLMKSKGRGLEIFQKLIKYYFNCILMLKLITILSSFDLFR